MGYLDTILAIWGEYEAAEPAEIEGGCVLSALSPDPRTKPPSPRLPAPVSAPPESEHALAEPVAPVAPWPPRPAELAEWPIPWRERWGRLANQLQDQGVPWPDHERQAFDRVKAEMAEGGRPIPTGGAVSAERDVVSTSRDDGRPRERSTRPRPRRKKR